MKSSNENISVDAGNSGGARDARAQITVRKLDELVCRGNCELEGLRGMTHSIILGFEGGCLTENTHIATQALYGVLYAIDRIEEIFQKVEGDMGALK